MHNLPQPLPSLCSPQHVGCTLSRRSRLRYTPCTSLTRNRRLSQPLCAQNRCQLLLYVPTDTLHVCPRLDSSIMLPTMNRKAVEDTLDCAGSPSKLLQQQFHFSLQRPTEFVGEKLPTSISTELHQSILMSSDIHRVHRGLAKAGSDRTPPFTSENERSVGSG